MPQISAGLLLYRLRGDRLEVLLAHPGGPFFVARDDGVWTIPKGLVEPDEDDLAAARREFEEETGLKAEGTFVPLGEITQKGGKIVRAWAVPGDVDPGQVRSNLFTMEWPPKSGRWQEFVEVDRAAFFGLDEAKRKIIPEQVPLLEALARLVPARDPV